MMPWERSAELYGVITSDFMDADYEQIYVMSPHSGGPYACSIYQHTSSGKERVKVEWVGLNSQIVITIG